MKILRWIGWLLALPFIALALYCAFALIAYRDIPVDVLEARYGGPDLQQQTVDGVAIRYRVSGPLDGSRPIVVLIHSHFWTMRMWERWMQPLQGEFTLLRYDMTSHGLTGPDPSEDYSAERGADLLNGLMNALQIDKVSLVGSSSGAAVAYTMASQFPDKVEKLVLMNAPGMPKMKNKWVERGMPSWVGFMFYLLPKPLFKPFLEFAVVDKSLISDATVDEFHEMYRREGNRKAEFLRMSRWQPYDMPKILQGVTAPVLIQWGLQNQQLAYDDAEDFKQLLVNAAATQIIIYPDAAHVLPIEKPQASAEDVRQFLLQPLPTPAP